MALGQEDKVARRYGKALFEACDPTAFDQTLEQLAMLSSLWTQSEDFRECNLNPRITDSQRSDALESVIGSLGGWKSEPVKRTVHILVSLRKAAVLPRLEEVFAAFVREYRKNLALEITSAQPLGAEEAAQMRERLSAALGGEVTLSTRHDPTLIGGITVRLGDKYLDRSVAGTLSRLAEQLTR